MTLDTDHKIATGRSWRDLPDAPPEGQTGQAVPDAVAPTAASVTGSDVDTAPLPVAPPAEPPVSPADAGARSVWPWVIGSALAVAVVALVLLWSPWSSASINADDFPALANVDEPVAAVAANLLPSVVQIEQGSGFAEAVGSGFVYEDGRILTAAHVVAGASTVTIRTFDGIELTGTVLGGDPVADIAVVHVDSDVPPAPLALGEVPQVGQMAVAIGSPLGFEQSVTSGIVSGVGRDLEIGGTTLDSLIQTDAPINQGNSGGPLANRQGDVIGVNVAIATASGGSDGLGFAVGIDKAVEIASQFTIDNPQPESLEGAAGGFLDDLFGPGGALPFLGDDPLGDLEGMLDDLLPEGALDDLGGLFDGLLDSGDGDGLISTDLLFSLLLQLLLGGDVPSLGDGDLPQGLTDLFDLFLGEG